MTNKLNNMNNLLSERIVNEARLWLGTRFHHQGRVRITENHKGGCDCIGLVIGVASKLGLKSQHGSLISYLDNTNYNRLPDGEKLKTILETHLEEITDNNIKIGDVLLFKFDKNPQHVAIITDLTKDGLIFIIHAYAPSRKVVEHHLDEEWKEKIVGIYRFKEL